MRIFIFLVIVLIVAAMAYVRLAPVRPGAWSALPAIDGVGDVNGPRSFTAVRQVQTTPDGVLRALQSIASGTPRTKLISGNPAAERMVFESRSLVFGFPDYTTVGFADGLLVIHGRAKIGASDVNVNKARITGWLAQLGPLVVPLP